MTEGKPTVDCERSP